MQNRVLRISDLRKRSALFIALLGLVLGALPGSTWAGGLYISEFGSPSMGVADAGKAAVASDASTSFHNPAGMTRLDGRELMVTGGLLYSTVKFDPDADTPISGGDGGDAGGLAPVLGTFYVHSLSDDLKLGLNVISITGAVLDYDESWTGRYLNQDVSLLSVTLNPSIAYRINDWLSVGGGLGVMYAELEITAAVPPPAGTGQVEIDGDDWEVGFNLGALVELSEHTRLGIIYWSEIEPNFGGDVEVSPIGAQAGVDTDITLAQYIHASIYHEINDQFALLGTVGWEDWSAFEDINISTGRGSQKISRDWNDTWKFAAGLHYRPSEPWLLQVGFAYDTSPVGSHDRTPDMPIDRQIRYACGAQYTWSERLSVGGQFVYADMGDAKIRNDLLKGDYERNGIFFFSLNGNWKF